MFPRNQPAHKPPPRTNRAGTSSGAIKTQGKQDHKRCRRFKQYKLDPSKFIVNLSPKILTPEHLSILQKGLNFIPTPSHTNHIHTIKDTLLFNRRVRLAHFFQNYPEQRTDTIFPKTNKGWIPPSGIDPDIDSFTHHLLQSTIHKPPSGRPKNNLNPSELLALKDLQQDDSIVIKPADKGGATVIWSTPLYEQEALRQLNNRQHYRTCHASLTHDHHQTITHRLKELSLAGHLPPDSEKSLIHPFPRISPFYLLPKIHKPSVPGRPIVSGIDSPTDRISHVLDRILRPYVARLPSHIKDTRDFLCKLQSLGPLHDDDIMVTIDVSSLYTSIPHEEGIESVRQTLDQDRNLPIPLPTILELVEMTLTMNTFKFKNQHFHQIQGTAMGTKMAPNYANIFMGILEKQLIDSSDLHPSIWLRFIDDIFAIYRASEDEVKRHIDYLNQCHPTIKFTSNISRDVIDFLDVTVFRKPDNSIGTKLFVKPTNTGQYLNASSYHPAHQIRSIAYSQAIRIRLICSEIDDFDISSKLLLKNLTLCGHNHTQSKLAISKARSIIRDSLLHPPKKSPHKIIPFVVTYTPHNRHIPPLLKQTSNFLKPNPSNRKFLEHRLLVAFRKSVNLRDILVHSEHPPPHQPSISRPCMRYNCRLCEHVITTNSITSPEKPSGKFKIIGHNTCDSYSVIYAITCPACRHIYIGQTGRNIRIRISKHKRDINRRNRDQPVAKHFVDHDVESKDILVTILDNTARDKNTRLRLEEAWIRALDTLHPNGLNIHL